MQHGSWMPDGELAALARGGASLSELAEANARRTGWRPQRSTVLRHLERIGARGGRHRLAHADLIPWAIRPEHRGSQILRWLRAESRRRQGLRLTDADIAAIRALDDLLFGGVRVLVIGYHTAVGFHLLPKSSMDSDIIRWPDMPQH